MSKKRKHDRSTKSNQPNEISSVISHVGRPTKYNPKIHPQEMLHHMTNDGWFVCELAAKWGINRDTFYEWCEKHAEFSDTYKVSCMGKQAWWMAKLRNNLVQRKGGSFNAIAWSMAMRYAGLNTDERLFKIPGMPGATTAVEQTKIVLNALSEGQITTKEAQAIQNIITSSAQVEEITETKKMVDELKKVLKRK